ncbi:lipopolysaccharide biosynthesis protein [Pedobacter sp.]|uniref:lipopolysaccharide biosynthesis protein n=1 Tax=Pedobacter sp. TaxID=1411316 RepID=UPI003BAA1CEE
MANFTGFLKHGGNYLVASLATRSLAFISIPIYTRLLSTQDYGIVSIFMGVSGLLVSLIAFSTDRSVSRYFFDQKSEMDFKRFVGTSSILALGFFIFNSILLIYFAEDFGNLVGLNKNVVYLFIPFSLISIVGLTFEQIYNPLKKSKEIAVYSVINVFLGFALSVTFLLFMKTEKYYGQIWGQIATGFIMLFFWIRLIKPYFVLSFDKSYIKYIFTFSVPLIPYALSGVIIEQFGKIAIGSSQGMSEAGFYNLALSVSSIVNIVVIVTHQAWNPYYFEYMNSKNYKQLDSDFIKIFKITILVAFGVASFGKELGLLLAKEEFSGALYLIPIFTIGYIFSQLSFAYVRNFGYTRKTQYMTLTILTSGVSNVLLNVFFVKSFGQLGAAISFVISYIIMVVLAWFLNNYFVKLHTTPLRKLLFPLIIAAPFYILLYLIMGIESIFGAILIKGLCFCMLTVIILWDERNEILLFANKILKRS